MTVGGVRERTAVLSPIRGKSWFVSTADARGLDEETGLAVTVDVTGWIIDVDVAEVPAALPPELRGAEGLAAALRRAVGAAMFQHVLDNATQKVLTTEARQRAEDLLAGRATLTALRVEPSPPVVRPQEPVRPVAYHSDERWNRTWSGRSRDGEVLVVMSVIAGLERIEVDEEFIATTNAEMLRHALREAFHEADRASGEELTR